MATDVKEQKYVATDDDGSISSRKWHMFDECHALKGGAVAVSDREVTLLGLTECVHCRKRATGGPALDILEGFFGEDWMDEDDEGKGGPGYQAWRLHSYLKERGAYIALRRPASENPD